MQIVPLILFAVAAALFVVAGLFYLMPPDWLKGSQAPQGPPAQGPDPSQEVVTLREALVQPPTTQPQSVMQSPPATPAGSVTTVDTDDRAQNERTVLDELADPQTTQERRTEIETELRALGYRKVSVAPLPAAPTPAAPVESPQGSNATTDVSSEGVDEGWSFDDGFHGF